MFLDDVGGVDFSCANLPDNKPITILDLLWVDNILWGMTSIPFEKAQSLVNADTGKVKNVPLPILITQKEFTNLIKSLYGKSAFIGNGQ